MTITLPVTERDTAKKAVQLRASGSVPAVVYGPKQEPVSITLEAKGFDKVMKEAGESTIIELTGLKEPIEVLIKEMEFDPVKQIVTHVDFYAIERGKEMTTDVALTFVGEAPVEATGEGTVNKVLHEVEVTCMPNKLPSSIEVDISGLATLEDKILVSDIKVPEGVKIEDEAAEPVVVVGAVKEQVEEEETSEEVDMDAIEVEQKGKEETTEEEPSA